MLLPYDVDRPRQNPPMVVVGLVLANYLVVAVIGAAYLTRGPDLPVAWIVSLGLIPSAPRWYAAITGVFLHQSVWHVSVNMLFLWVFGAAVEDTLGWRRFLALYLLAGAATGALQAVMLAIAPGVDRSAPIIGASGAVATVVGVFAARYYRSRIRFVGLPWRVPAIGLIAAALAAEMGAVIVELVRLQTLASFGTAHWAHIGGFVLGMGIAQVLRMPILGRHEYQAADAQAYLASGSPLAAIRRLESSIRRAPENPALHLDLARAWAAAGDGEQSAASYARAVGCALQQGSKQTAMAAYRAYAAEHEASLEPAVQFGVACALDDSGDAAAARGAFERLLRDFPGAADAEMAHLRLAAALVRRLGEREAGAAVLAAFRERFPHTQYAGHADALIDETRRA